MNDARVLIVEDEALVAMALEDSLTEAGFIVVSAEDGASAIRKLEAEGATIDAVVTDIRMPGKSKVGTNQFLWPSIKPLLS